MYHYIKKLPLLSYVELCHLYLVASPSIQKKIVNSMKKDSKIEGMTNNYLKICKYKKKTHLTVLYQPYQFHKKMKTSQLHSF